MIDSELRVFTPSEFRYDVSLFMDSIPCDDSAAALQATVDEKYNRASVLEPMQARDMERRIILGEFPGADDPNNGPNHSSIGGLQAYAVLTSKIPLDVLGRYTKTRVRYSSLVHSQIFMFTFWGHFKTASFRSVCRKPMDADLKASIIWTGASHSPASASSPYNSAFAMLKRAMDAANDEKVLRLRGGR
jgi:hypothetical protein